MRVHVRSSLAASAALFLIAQHVTPSVRAQMASPRLLWASDSHPVHIMTPRQSFGTTASASEAVSTGFATVYPSPYESALLTEHGGPEMGNPAVVVVYWNATVANSTATSLGYATISSEIDAFLNAFSSHVNWTDSATADYSILQQYGRATSISNTLTNLGGYVDAQPTLGSISDVDIRSHLAALFAGGTLAPSANIVYSIVFPPSMQVTISSTSVSCSAFCAYHSAFFYNGVPIKYTVHPYPGCASCSAGAVGDNLTITLSHEIRETVTNPTFTGWYDPSGNEADDKCAWWHLYRMANGGFLVQPEWSNGGTVTASGFTATYPGPGCVVPSNAVPRSFGDFDGDGRADLAVFRPSSGVWYVNNGMSQAWGVAGDIPVAADYAGTGRMQVAVFRPSTAQWFINGQGAVQFGAPGDIPVPADYDGDGRADIAVFRPSTGTWLIRGRASVAWGAPGDIPVPGDYSGVGHAQIAVYRRGAWYVFGQSAVSWGVPGDVPVPADYDGNGTIDIAIYRPSTATWFVRNQFSVAFGAASDIPVPLDVDGDRRAELVLFRPADGTWRSYTTLNGSTSTSTFGVAGDIPITSAASMRRLVRADADGDGRGDLILFRPSDTSWNTRLSSAGFASGTTTVWGGTNDTPVLGDFVGTRRMQPAVFHDGAWSIMGGPSASWGTTGDIPVVADYDGDGRSDIAVFRHGEWYVLLSTTGFSASRVFTWGAAGDVPVAADFDGDGRADLAVFRAGTWFILTSSTNYSAANARTIAWGTDGDIPVAADYDGDGAADVAVFRPSSGVWYVIRSSDRTSIATSFGAAGDIPVPADFDGVGFVELAVYRPSTATWYVLGNFSTVFGQAGDVVVLRP